MFETVVVEMGNENCNIFQVSEVLVITTLFIRKQGYKIMKTITSFFVAESPVGTTGLVEKHCFYR